MQNYVLSSGTSTILRHLEEYYNIKEDTFADKRAKNIQINIEEAMILVAETPQKRRKLNKYNSGDMPLNRDVIKVLYVRFIAACNMLLRLIKCAEFRAFFSYLNKDVDCQLNYKHNTIRI